jgi:hypothetical protein
VNRSVGSFALVMILTGSIWTDGAAIWACVPETAHPAAKVTIAAAVTANSPVLAVISVLPSGSSLVLGVN